MKRTILITTVALAAGVIATCLITTTAGNTNSIAETKQQPLPVHTIITISQPQSTIADNQEGISKEPEAEFKTYDIKLSEELQKTTFNICKEYGVEYELALAIMAQESNFRTKIISKTNDHGLMQINACNHEWLKSELGVTDIMDPEQNIRCGVYMISNMLNKYEDYSKALMAYNLGESGAKKQWEKGVTSTAHSRGILDKLNQLKTEGTIK